MKVSVNWVKRFVDFELPPIDELVERIGAQLGAVEEVIDLGAKYKGILIAKVMSCENHPNADRLHVCKLDDGGKAQDVERDENGYVQVVCGAPNVREGLLVAWLPPGATVPNTYDKEPFVLDARELRGVKSNGMLASPHELALSENHDGILEIDKDAAPGDDFAATYALDDYIIDIENKMFTHRPDCFGILGVAREIAGILGQPFTSPDWYLKTDASLLEGVANNLPLAVDNQLPKDVPRFMAIAMSNVDASAQSPIWMQTYLNRAGVRPISAVVDITNYMMLLTGQPLHAYDYDKVKALSEGEVKLVVRHPKSGEKITLLNGKEIEPRAEAIMIATDKKLIGIGGVMGGADTEVDENTKNIILECANFDMYSIRRTSMAHGLFTDAVTRFNKGQSPYQNDRILAKTVQLVTKVASGQTASHLADNNHVAEDQSAQELHEAKFVNERLGLNLELAGIRRILENVEFEFPDVSGRGLLIKPPFWRTDIGILEDIVEEVGRLYGFEKIPLVLPQRSIAPTARNVDLELKALVREKLSRAGANELLTYNFVHENLLSKVGQDKNLAFRLSNALSPDLQYFRLSLLPSLLEKVHANIKAGYDQFALFEINKVHSKSEIDEDGLPNEFMRVALTYAANEKVAKEQLAGAPYYVARKYLVELLAGAMLNLEFKPLSEADFGGHQLTEQMTKPFDANRSAIIMQGAKIVGVVGEYRASVRRALKLPDCSAGFEIFTSVLVKDTAPSYKQLPRFPKVEQDICLKVEADMPYDDVFTFVWNHLHENRPDKTYHTLSAVDIYQREDDADYKQITLRISIASFERTLTDVEVSGLLDSVATVAQQELGAQRI